ncbi:hypothetical protein [Polaribacter gangjinensis]|uniref:Uncharacterized protein n=1 Tax=Polaribacter gangjinensis TaxID=574710 RepID=A0A2S7W839_9FLAO|nr:hypothetical protein [Polaribacter gangjinensis]PQJ73779.1 hypothetical protein BTO13_00130 [Polaribacter gangjinensis]
MKIEIDFYTKNPFEKEASFRLQGITADSQETQLYEVFLKNMISYVYYQTNVYHQASDFIDYYGNLKDVSLQILLRKYFIGNLKTGLNVNSFASPIIDFCVHEFQIFERFNSIESELYIQFIRKYYNVFRRIDTLVDFEFEPTKGDDFLGYLNNYGLILPHINIELIASLLDQYFVVVCKNLCRSYINSFDENDITDWESEIILRDIYVAMKFDLLEENEQAQLVLYSKRWILQLFKSFSILKNIRYNINNKGDFIFQPFIDKFSNYFSFAEKKVVAEKSYPTHIFATYEVYHLFNTLAQGLRIKVSVSFVYRLLHEKGLILVKDAPFREWYNLQSYPLTLSTATETLANSKSSEREQFVAIVASLLGVTL